MEKTVKRQLVLCVGILILLIAVLTLILVWGKYVKTLDGTPKPVTVESTYRTVLYSDRSFVVNESLADYETKTDEGLTATAIYAPLNSNNSYIFESADAVPWKDQLANIKTATIANPISPTDTSYWFYGCSQLTSVDLSNMTTGGSVNAPFTKMTSMFEGCSLLTAIDGMGDNFSTANVTNMSGAFSGCSSLAELDLGSFNTSQTTNMEYIFKGCSSLEKIFASNGFDVTSVVDESEMFTGCVKLVGGAGTTFDVTKVGKEYARIDQGPTSDAPGYFTDANIPRAYYSVNNASTLHISPTYRKGYIPCYGILNGFSDPSKQPWASDTFENVVIDDSGQGSAKLAPQGMDYWFADRTSIESIDLTNLDACNLKSLMCTFSGCTSLKTLDLSHLKTTSLENMQGVFQKTTSLETLRLGGDFTTENVQTMASLFAGTSSTLESSAELEIIGMKESFKTSNVKTFAKMFNYCKFKSLDLSGFDITGIDSQEYNPLQAMFSKTCLPAGSTLDVSSFDTQSKNLSFAQMFAGMSGVKTVVFGENFKTDESSTFTNMFSGSSDLEILDLTMFSNEKVTSWQHLVGMFGNCSGLKTIYADPDKWVDKGIEGSASKTFQGCTELIGSDATGDVVCPYDSSQIGFGYAIVPYKDASGNIHSGYFTDPNAPEVTPAYYMVDNGKLLLSPDKKTGYTFNQGIVKGFSSADDVPWKDANFTGVEVKLGDEGTTKLTPRKMDYWFNGKTTLTSIDEAAFENLDTSDLTSMNYTFNGCTSLADIYLLSFAGGSITSMDHTFAGCTNLNSIYATPGSWDVSMSESVDTFTGDNKLIGRTINGTHFTEYSEELVSDASYAHLDSLTSPGYFSPEGSPLAPTGFWKIENDTLFLSPTGGTGYTEEPRIITGFNYNTPPWIGQSHRNVIVEEGDDGQKLAPKNLDLWFVYDGPELESIDVTKLDTTKAKSAYAMFAGCCNEHFTQLDVSCFENSRIENMESMFNQCYYLQTLNNSDKFNTEYATNMYEMFYQCYSINNLDLTGFDTSNVINMAEMFQECYSLTDIDLSSFNTSNVEAMDAMFRQCYSLKNIDLSSFSSERLSAMRQMFLYDESLETIYAKDTFTGPEQSESTSVFVDCEKLVGGAGTVYDSSHLGSSYARIDQGPDSDAPGYFTDKDAIGAFYKVDDSTSTLHLSPDYKSGYKYEPRIITGFEQKSDIPWYDATFNFQNVVVDLGNDVANLAPEKMDYWFYDKAITSVDFSNLDTSNLKSMNRTFQNCASLETLDLSKFDSSSVESMTFTFCDTLSLKTLILGGEFTTKNVNNLQGIFSGSRAASAEISPELEIIGMSESLKTSNVDNFSMMFEYRRFKSLDLSGFDTSSAGSLATIGAFNYMFRGTTMAEGSELDLSSFTLPEGVTTLAATFDSMKGINSIIFGENFNTENIILMLNTFKGFQGTTLDLTSFSNESLVNARNTQGMFDGCPNLRTVYVDPEKWTYKDYGKSTFAGCTNLIGSNADGSIVVPFDPNQVLGNRACIPDDTHLGYFTDPDAPSVVTSYYEIENGTLHLSPDSKGTGYIFEPKILEGFSSADDVPWKNDDVTSVVVELGNDGITKLAPEKMDYWFNGLTSLTAATEASFENLNTSELTSMNYTFNGCTSISEIYLLNFAGGNIAYLDHTFAGCPALRSIYATEGRWDECISESQDTFTGDESLVGRTADAAHYTKYSEAGVQDASYAHLDSITKPGYFSPEGAPIPTSAYYKVNDEHTVLYLSPTGGAGYTEDRRIISGYSSASDVPWLTYKTTLSSVVIEGPTNDDDLITPTKMDYWFYQCSSLQTIEGLSNINSESLTSMGNTFNGCSSIETVDLSSFVNDNLKNMEYAFSGCSKLKTIYATSGKWKSGLSISGTRTFYLCGSLIGRASNGHYTRYNSASIEAPYAKYARVDVDDANPGYLTEPGAPPVPTGYYKIDTTNGILYLSPTNDGTYTHEDRIVTGFTSSSQVPWYGKTIKTVQVVRGTDGSKLSPEKMAYWFYNLSKLTSVDLSELNTANAVSAYYMFYGCSTLATLNLSSFDTSKMESFGNMFARCTALSNLDISSFDTSSATSMTYMFYSCSKIKSLDLRHFDGRLLTDTSYMFNACGSLDTIKFGSNFTMANVTRATTMFSGCTNLKTLEGSNYFATTKLQDASYMFEKCQSLTTLDLSNFNTSQVSNIVQIFYRCATLQTITSNTFDTSSVSGSTEVFTGCFQIKGGAGTTYEDSKTGVEYARVDGEGGLPGYFTSPTSAKEHQVNKKPASQGQSDAHNDTYDRINSLKDKEKSIDQAEDESKTKLEDSAIDDIDKRLRLNSLQYSIHKLLR